MIALEFWYMFPVGIVVATVAMMSGVGGATMFTPLFLLGLHLEPAAALASGLCIEVFGFTSGVMGYARKQLICYSLVKQVLPYTLLGTLGGALITLVIPKLVIELLLVTILLYVAIQFLSARKVCTPVMWPHRGVATEKVEVTQILSFRQRMGLGFGGGVCLV